MRISCTTLLFSLVLVPALADDATTVRFRNSTEEIWRLDSQAEGSSKVAISLSHRPPAGLPRTFQVDFRSAALETIVVEPGASLVFRPSDTPSEPFIVVFSIAGRAPGAPGWVRNGTLTYQVDLDIKGDWEGELLASFIDLPSVRDLEFHRLSAAEDEEEAATLPLWPIGGICVML